MKRAKLLRSFVSIIVTLTMVMGNTVVWADSVEDTPLIANEIGNTPLVLNDNQSGGTDDAGDDSEAEDSELIPDQIDSYGFDSIVADAEAEQEYRDSVEYEDNKIVFSVIQYRQKGDQAVYLKDTDDVCKVFKMKNVSFILETKTDKVEPQDGYTAYQMFYEATVNVEDIWQLVDEMRANEDIYTAEPDFIWEKADEPDMTEVSGETLAQEVEAAGWCYQDLDCMNIWNNLTPGHAPGEGVIVAVIDTGVDYNHIDLKANMWTNPNEIPSNGIDDDGNGYIDDVHGINLIDPRKQGDPMDDMGHGTHVAGVIAMTPGNGGGVGIAYGSKIMAVKAGQANGYFSSTDIAKAVVYAAANGADVINMSFGGTGKSALVEAALSDAFGTCVLVAAAGNDGVPTNDAPFISTQDIYPAGYNYVIGVMASDQYGNKARFSNWDYHSFKNCDYELVAPGVSIFSCLPNNRYACWSGTSMAAPAVAATAAIIRREYSNKSKYSSRYIYGQLCSATEDTVLYIDDYGLSHIYNKLNIWDSLNKSPNPDVYISDIVLFDSSMISEDNNGDKIVQPGETVDVGFFVSNRWGSAKDVEIEVDCDSVTGIANSYVELVNGNVSISGGIGTMGTSDNGFVYSNDTMVGVENPIRIKILDSAPNNLLVTLNILIHSKNAMNELDLTDYTFETSYTFEIQKGSVLKGLIEENTVLDSERLWIVDGNVLIPAGVSVEVMPGTELQFNKGGNLIVEGVLSLNGSLDSPIEIYPNENWEGGRVNISEYDSGTAGSPYYEGIINMSYVRMLHPAISGMEGVVDHCEFLGGGYVRLLDASVSNTKFMNDALSSSDIYDQVLFNSSCPYSEYPGNIRLIENSVILSRVGGSQITVNVYRNGRLICYQSTITNNALLASSIRPGISSLYTYNEAQALLTACDKYYFYIKHNYFGTDYQDKIEEIVWDQIDDATIQRADYSDYYTLCDDMSSIYPFVTEAFVTDIDGNRVEEVTNNQVVQIHVRFNRDMAQSNEYMPLVSYGPTAPYTDFRVDGGWIDSREWVGVITIDPFIDQGIQHLRIKDAAAADDKWLTTGVDVGRFDFKIVNASADSLTLQGTGGNNQNNLSWIQDDYETLAGYNLYRSKTYNVEKPVEIQEFIKVNSTIIASNTYDYIDNNVEQGQDYYYYFTVVDTDFNESQASNVVKCTPIDAESPIILSTAIGTVTVGTPISVTANVTDNVAVTQVDLYYKMRNDDSWQQTVMRNTVDDMYQAVIPGYAVEEGTLEYYIVAYDGTNTTYCGSVEIPNVISVVGIVNVESVSLSDVEIEMLIGDTATITAEVFPDDATDKEVTWLSSDEDVVTVDNGQLVAIGVGTTTVTVTTADGQHSAICNVKVNPILVDEVELSEDSKELLVGESFVLGATIFPDNATDRTLNFISSDSNIATVDADGTVIAIGVGEADIIVSTNDNSDIEKVCHVIVNPVVVQSVALNCVSKTVEINDGFELTAIIYPNNATDKSVTWESSNPTIASVDDGMVTAKTLGKATITVITTDGEKTAICNIEVVHTSGHTVVIDEAVMPDCTHAGLTEGSHCSVCGEVIDQQEVIPALGHTEVIVDTVDPTCTETGLTAGTKCSECGEIIVAQELIEAKGHNVVIDAEVTPTCEDTGLTAGCHCSECGEIIVAQEEIPANGHTEVILDAVEPDCTHTGLTEGSYCSVCNMVLVPQDVIPALGHKMVMDPSVLPTCEETGLTAGCHCEDCDEIIVAQEVIPALGHSAVIVSEIPATCIGEGISEGTKCSVCGEVLSGCAVIPATGHFAINVSAVPATCTKDGTTAGVKCSECCEILSGCEVIHASGHTVVDVDEVPATCTQYGTSSGTKCSECGEILSGCQVIPAHGHTVEYVAEIPATCTETGVSAGVKCSVCHKILSGCEVIQVLGHSAEEVEEIPATCTEDGVSEGTKCSVCGEVLSGCDVVPATGHAVVNVAEIPVTCTKDGTTAGVKCSECGEILSGCEVIHASGHTVVDVDEVPATCTQYGISSGTKCSACGEILSGCQVIPAYGHTVEYVAEIPATCTEAGVSAGVKCTVCNKILSGCEVVEPQGHTVESVSAISATCTEDGMTSGTKCSVCGEVLTGCAVIPATGHSVVNVAEIPATCTKDGTTAGVKCSECGEILSGCQVIHALGHTTVDVDEVPATCTQYGTSAGTKCSECGAILSGCQVIPAHGHDVEYVVEIPATCTEAGVSAGVKCTVCNKILSGCEAVPALGHLVEEVEEIPATCTEEGVSAGTKCSICGEVLSGCETIPATGHSVINVSAIPVTCTKDGTTTGVKCSECGEILSGCKVIHSLGHTVVDVNEVSATCTQSGTSAGTKCSECGEILSGCQVIPAHGHVVEYVAEIPATCTEAGVSAGVKCSVCNKILSGCETIKANGHTVVTDPAVEPATSHNGLTEGSHCSVCGTVIVKQEIIPALIPTNTPTPTTIPTVKPTATPIPAKPTSTPTPTVEPAVATPTSVPTAAPTNKVPPTVIPTIDPTGSPVPVEPTVTVTPTPTIDPKRQISEFASRLYEYVLNREPESGGLDYWTDELYSFRQSGAEVAQGFIFSQEFIDRNTSDEEFVTILYKTFFGRNPEAEGFNYWVGTLKNGTNDRVAVANGFIYSLEWANTCAEYGIRSGGDTKPSVNIDPSEATYVFVERMYTTAMKRASDPEGAKYWSGELANFNFTGEQVGAMFFLSDEMTSMNLDNKEFVTRLYKTFMDRDPDQGGFDYWVKYLDDGNQRADAVYGFTRSEEFVKKCIEARILPY